MLGLFRRNDEFNLRQYDRLILSVKYEEQKIRNWIARLEKKRSELISKMNLYKKRNQLILAGIYAKEIENLTILRDVLNYINLKFLAISERLQTIKVVLKAASDLKPLIKSLDEIFPVIASLPVKVEDTLKQLVTSYTELLYFVSPPNAQIKFDLMTPEASEILREVESKVEEEVLKAFPSLPLAMTKTEGKLTDKIGELVEVFAADGGFSLTHRKEKKKLTTKDKVLRYIRLTGNMNVYACARYLNTSPEKVIEALYELAEEGKLKFKA
ncbi:hypothetical protein DRN86_01915 [Candidatus Geothermarchaeota archaeon]|nr:MAG: hypothetical protein DRN86_01915 [Candidatus Geothermarchaeota archaeon]